MPPTARYLVCTAIRPAAAMPFFPVWRTETALALARGILTEEAFDRLPVLADALEEAGCDDPLVLRHCRECQDHRPHCWVLGDVLDISPVVEPVQMTDAEIRREVERVTGQPLLRPSDASWDEPSPARFWVLRAVPVVVTALVLSWFGWASLSPPLTGTQFPHTVPTVSKAASPSATR